MASDVKAISSYKVFLMEKKGSTWTKLVDIKDYPDFGSTPDLLSCTTLSDGREWGIPDIIKQGDSLTFTVNYLPATMKALDALNDGNDHTFALYLGGTVANGVATPTGENGAFLFTGQLVPRMLGKGVSEVTEIEIAITPSSGPDFYETPADFPQG